MVQASCDRPDLASTLVRSQVAFAAGTLAVQVRLTFYACGVGTPNVADLLKLFNGMRIELRTLVPAAMPVGAKNTGPCATVRTMAGVTMPAFYRRLSHDCWTR